METFYNVFKKKSIFLPSKSWKKHPQKLPRKTQIHFFSLLPAQPKQPKQKNSCSKMWPIEQLYIELGIWVLIPWVWYFVGQSKTRQLLGYWTDFIYTSRWNDLWMSLQRAKLQNAVRYGVKVSISWKIGLLHDLSSSSRICPIKHAVV